MKPGYLTIAILFLFGPAGAESGEDYKNPKELAEALPRATDLGERWQPVHPDRWLTVNAASVTAMYERRAEEAGKIDASVIADCFIYPSATEAAKALKAKRSQISAYPTAVITEMKSVAEGAFASHHRGEEDQGNRVTFAIANVVVTISPSPASEGVAKKIFSQLKQND